MTAPGTPGAAVTAAGRFERTVRAVVVALSALAAIAVVLVMVVTIVDVMRRSTTGRSLPGTVDYGELLMVAAVFLGLGYAQHRREHVSVELVTARVPPQLARWLRLVGIVVAIGLVAWMVVATSQEAFRSFGRNEFRFGLVRVPVWPARAVIPVGALVLLAQLAVDMLRLARSRPTATSTSAGEPGDAAVGASRPSAGT